VVVRFFYFISITLYAEYILLVDRFYLKTLDISISDFRNLHKKANKKNVHDVTNIKQKKIRMDILQEDDLGVLSSLKKTCPLKQRKTI